MYLMKSLCLASLHSMFSHYFSGTMIRLFKVKEKQRELAESANGKPPVKKQSAGELRLQKGLLFCIDKCLNIFFINI